jgi:hypothetical protein
MKPIVALALCLAAAACQRGNHCAPGGSSTVEIRNGSGALVLALQGNTLCDAAWNKAGTLDVKKDTVTLNDAAGKLRLELTRDSANAGRGRDREGPHLRLWHDAHEWRVMRADGVPLGSVQPQTARDAIVYNQASSPLAKVSLRDRDVVVTDMAGTALTFVHPSSDFGAAGVFGVPSLDPAEQLALYIYWSR